MAGRRSSTSTCFFSSLLCLVGFMAFVPVLAPPPCFSASCLRATGRRFEIADDMFWKDGVPFQIIGGDLHYFRVIPEYWEDRLLRAKAMGLNTIQTYVPWNLHEPRSGDLVFHGIANVVYFLKLCQKLGFLVMLRVGPYICAEWDLGGFPPWLLATNPAVKLRSADPAFIQLVVRWWGNLLPKVAPLLYDNGGAVIMIQIENEYGSYGNDKAYLHQLVMIARAYLGKNVILYTIDGGSRENLENGTIRGDMVYSAVDFPTGYDPWPIFKLQKEFNAPGKSPRLSAEFYTGWLTHWGEKIAKTSASSTASALKKILSRNGSAVLYMIHGGTNFGFYNGANADSNEYDFKPDITSYDYDAPIRESGDVDNAKFKALKMIVEQFSGTSVSSVPLNNQKAKYGPIQLHKTASLFSALESLGANMTIESENPLSMESVGQAFGFLLYVTEYSSKSTYSTLSIPKVHDRAQVFITCPSKINCTKPIYVGKIERWSNQTLHILNIQCNSNISLQILVENMGRVNYGAHMFDRKGILSSVYLDGNVLHRWKMVSVPFHNLNEPLKRNPVFQAAQSKIMNPSTCKKFGVSDDNSKEPAFYHGHFLINASEQVKDTFLSFHGWSKGIAFVNNFNIGRFWPSRGPQCNLYVPAPILQLGKNLVEIVELESPNLQLLVWSVAEADFGCGSSYSITPRHTLSSIGATTREQ